jgi:hypothetical protein
MRILLIMNSLYISIASNRNTKYKMTPTKICNTDFAFVIWKIGLIVFNI